MPPKRPRDALTGGTKDVNPQYIRLQSVQTAADTFTSEGFPLPQNRFQETEGFVVVLEFLRVTYQLATLPLIAAVGETIDSISASISTGSIASAPTIATTGLVGPLAFKQRVGAFTAGGTYAYIEPIIYDFDLTDAAGHGILVATDNIFVNSASVTTGNSNTTRVLIEYRFKKVTLAEYVGIVQAQSVLT